MNVIKWQAPKDPPSGRPRLPGSGLCQGRAVNHLNIVDGTAPQLISNDCSWVVNEAPMPGGDYLLYLAASCKGHVTQLAYAAGARFAEIRIARSGMSEGQPGSKIITIGTADQNNPHRNVLLYAQNAMDNPAEARRCQVRKAGSDGWPSDALIVDVSAAEAATNSGPIPKSGVITWCPLSVAQPPSTAISKSGVTAW